jgi:hypothetical protein
MAVLLVTQQFLTDNSFINDNVDYKLLKPIIVTVQDMYIHPILGTALYNQIRAQVTTPPVSSQNQTLLDDYIQPAITWRAMQDAPFHLTYKFMNKSVVKRNSENSEVPSSDELIMLSDKFREKAEFYTKRLIKFLEANSTTYTLYVNPGDSCDTIYPYKTAYETGMFLDDDGIDLSSMKYRGIEPINPEDCDCL